METIVPATIRATGDDISDKINLPRLNLTSRGFYFE